MVAKTKRREGALLEHHQRTIRQTHITQRGVFLAATGYEMRLRNPHAEGNQLIYRVANGTHQATCTTPAKLLNY